MNVNFQIMKRLLCCLLAVLILCGVCLKPMAADAAAIAAGVAAIGGVEFATVCAGILASLGVCYGLSTIDYENLVDRISDVMPTEYIMSKPKYDIDFTNVISYNDTTYVPKSLVDCVQQYLYAPSDGTTAVLTPTYSPSGDFGTMLQKARYRDTDGILTSVSDYSYCYEMLASDGRRDLFFTNKPVRTRTSSDKWVCSTKGDTVHVYQTASDLEDGFIRMSHYDADTTATYTKNRLVSLNLADVSSVASSNAYDLVIGNLAPDLDDEDYASWSARQKLFVVKPSGDGDGDGDSGNDNEQKVWYVPVRLLEKFLECAGQTQSDAQSGRNSTADLDTSLVPNTSAEPAVKPSPGIDASGDVVPAELDGTETGKNTLGWLSLIYKALVNVMYNILNFFEFVRAIPAHIQSLFEWIWEHLNSAFEALKTAIQTSFEWIWEHLNTAFETLKTTIQTSFEWIWEHLNTAFETLKTTIQTSFEWLWQKLGAFFADVSGFLDNFWSMSLQALRSLGDYILNGIKSIFVPSEDFITEKLEAVKAKFPFVSSIIDTGKAIGLAFTGFYTEPPIIYAELHNATGSYYYGDRAVILDLRWYSEYKPTVDILISAFLWAVFCWRTFIKIPGIISGMPGDFVMDTVSQAGMVDRLPSRKVGYEIQRQSNREYIRNIRRGGKE